MFGHIVDTALLSVPSSRPSYSAVTQTRLKVTPTWKWVESKEYRLSIYTELAEYRLSIYPELAEYRLSIYTEYIDWVSTQS